MNLEKLKQRQMTIKEQHDKVFDRMNELQQELSQLSAQRLQLEGAFGEVTELIKELEESSEHTRDTKKGKKTDDDGDMK